MEATSAETQMKISDSEWEVMRVLWTLGYADAQEITGILGASMNWKLATVKTLLGRLVKKNAITTETVGKKFRYFPAVSEEETIQSATENLFSHVCAKKMGATIADLIQDAELTAADIALIQQTLTDKVATPYIACNCIPGQCECKEHQN
ncbi:CopY/TcrY family copper transport repressor [Enterococcus asini]|uniref:CopY/TcrY family copper transport repressor n=1 Tax=Enterococcus asini TaxID=57732 RepID=UPI00288D3B05|nr:CopY/TcrY family copper transport repressor [Enterococcus asini]MDT2756129.1 CopY/TcrY family copper transport repressor [Enterococcus asini]